MRTPEELAHVSITPNSETKFTSNTSNKLSDKFKDLDVKGSLQISCLAGLVPLGSGFGNYLNRNITGYSQSRIHVRIRRRTCVKGLDMRKLDQMGFHELMDHPKATHAVIQIHYGAEGVFTFTKQLENDEDEKQVRGALQAGADSFVNAVIAGETGSGAQVRNLTGKGGNNTEIKCEFEGDFQTFDTKTPTNYDEAMKFSRKLMTILSESMAKEPTGEPLGVPYTVWLYPLEQMRNLLNLQAIPEQAAVHKEMRDIDTFEWVRIMEDYNVIEDQLNFMLEDPLAKKLKPFYGKLQDCVEFFTLFRDQLKTIMAKMLVDIRSGQAETENTHRAKQLLNRIKDDHHFSFHKRNLQQWLTQRTNELCRIKRFQDQIKKEMNKILNPDNGKGTAAAANNSIKLENVLFFPDMTRLLNQMVSNSSIQFGFEISFWTLLKSGDSFLEQMKQQTHEISNGDVTQPLPIGIQNRPEGKESNDEPNNHFNWYDDDATLNRIGTAIDVFVALTKENANNVGGDESFALALTAITDEGGNLEAEVMTEPSLFIYNKNGIKLHGSEALLYLCQHYRLDSRLLLDILRLWLGQQADMANSKNTDGWNALLLLCCHYSNDNLDEMVQLLADKGIDISWKNKDGWNALHLACTYYKNEKLVDIVRFLIDKKINVHCQTSEGYDALHLVCQHYNKTNLLQIVGLLDNNAGWRVHIDLFNILRKKSQWKHSIGILFRSKPILLVAITCLVGFLIIFLI